MSDYPKISVCIPAWNAGPTIRRCLVSLTRQDYPNVEIIVVDDGSTDATPSIIAREFPTVRILRGDHRGANTARNIAARQASGELLFFSDADCVYEPDALSALARALDDHPEASFAYSSFKLGWKLFRLRPYDVHALRERNYIPTRALIRKRDFPGFDEELKRLQDWDLWLTMAEQGKHGVWIPRVLYSTIASHRVMSSGWFPKFLYHIPAVANRLSRGAGMTLEEAEAIVRAKHARDVPRLPDSGFACPQCHAGLLRKPEGLLCPTCSALFRFEDDLPILLHPTFLTDFLKTEIEAHSELSKEGNVPPRDAYYHRHAKARLLRLPEGSRILEVACGERPDSLELARAGMRVVATDLATARVRRARRYAERLDVKHLMQFAVADGDRLPFSDASFDALLIAASFHHFPHPEATLREFRRVVRPGGLVVLELEPQAWPYVTVFRWLHPLKHFFRKGDGHVHSIGDDTTGGFTEQGMRMLIASAGLELVELRPVKCLSDLADQAARMIGKFAKRDWEAPAILRRPLEAADRLLEHVPGIRNLFWHWNTVARVRKDALSSEAPR